MSPASISFTVHCRLRQDAEKVLLQDSSVLLCCTWVYTFFSCCLVAFRNWQWSIHTTAQSSAHIGNIYNITQWNLHITACAGPQHIFERLLYTKEMSLVDQLVERLYTWGTCWPIGFTKHPRMKNWRWMFCITIYLVTPNIQEFIKKEQQETKEIEEATTVGKRKWSTVFRMKWGLNKCFPDIERYSHQAWESCGVRVSINKEATLVQDVSIQYVNELSKVCKSLSWYLWHFKMKIVK